MSTAPTSDRVPTAGLQRWWGAQARRRLLWALTALATLWLLAWLLVPPLLKSQLEQRASQYLGRAVTVDRVDFTPWSMDLRLQGLRIAGSSPDQGPLLLVEAVRANAELSSVLRFAPVVDALHIDNPQLNITHQGGGRYDIDDVLAILLAPDDNPEPARFVLNDVQVKGGYIQFNDLPVQRTHHIRQIHLELPFLSSLPSHRDEQTTPHLSFELNGSPFDTRAQSTPFAQSRATQAKLVIAGLDLEPYLPYWPAVLPVRLANGVLRADLSLDFEATEASRLLISGTVGLAQARWVERRKDANVELLAWDDLTIQLDRAAPLQQQLHLSAVQWQGPVIRLTREASGQINLARLAQKMRAASPPPAPAASQTTPSGWQLQLDQLAVTEGVVHWQDATLRPAAQWQLQGLQLQVKDAVWPAVKPLQISGKAQMGSATFDWEGSATDRIADVRWQVQALPLALLRPYAASTMAADLQGAFSTAALLEWRAASANAPSVLRLKLDQAQVDQFRLQHAGKTPLALNRLHLQNALIDLSQRQIDVGRLELQRPDLTLERDAQGQLSYQRWLRPSASAPSNTQAATTKPNAPWGVQLRAFQLSEGKVLWTDRQTPRRVRLELSGIQLTADQLALLPGKSTAFPLKASMKVLALVGQTRGRAGRIEYQGKVTPPDLSGRARPAAPLATTGRLTLDHLPLHALTPYVAERLNLDLLRAEGSYRGSLQMALPATGLNLKLNGQAALEDVDASTLAPKEDLLRWKSLQLRGVQVDVQAGALKRLNVQETVLSDYFARILVDETGHLNLAQLVKPDTPATEAPAPGAVVASTTASAPATPTTSAASEPALITFGPISVVKGDVYFTDRYIQPNYAARLSELTGSLGAFSNQAPAAGAAPALADLSLRGRAEGTATLDISGKVNPLAKPLSLDIQARVNELELPPLTPYAVKYAGYGIERGKLSTQVRYLIEPDGKLTATNQIILNQLQFGDRVEGSEAPNLPIKLAVALLADSNGVIDIDLPISGSINDPQFRVGPLIVRMVFNLIGKAITAPFALIARAFGGSHDEMNQIEFMAGESSLSETARQRLDGVAKALQQRPALSVTITGQSDPQAEREGYQRARLRELMAMEKRRRMARAGDSIDGQVIVNPDEEAALLKEVYKRADIPKPRNIIGIAKDLPGPEMEKLLLASITVNDDKMRELAVARAVAVKDYLAAQQVELARLFLANPKVESHESAWTPLVDLQVSTR